LLYQWRSGALSDDELLTRLQPESTGDIGNGTLGIAKLVVGEVTEGTEILTTIIAQADA